MCYEQPGLPLSRPGRSTRALADLPLVSALTDRRAILAGALWMGVVVTAARLFDSIEIGVRSVLALSIPCWIAGAFASLCPASFPDRLLVRVLGAVAGFAVAGCTKGLQTGIGLFILAGFGLPLTVGLHWVRQAMRERCEG